MLPQNVRLCPKADMPFSAELDSGQSEKFWPQQHRLVCPKAKRFAMYALIIVIAVLSPAGGAVTPVGVTSQVLRKFKNLDQCKTAGTQQGAGGAISDLSLSRGIYWYCAYVGPRSVRLGPGLETCQQGRQESAAKRAARAFSDTPTPGFSCASAPCLSRCRARLRIVRCAHAMP